MKRMITTAVTVSALTVGVLGGLLASTAAAETRGDCIKERTEGGVSHHAAARECTARR